MSRDRPTWFRYSLILYVAWGLLYIYRTSFEHNGLRVFSLWDDAMVSMRYAKNLAGGHGLVWFPGGDRVEGFSNLGVTLLMTAIHRLPVSLTHTSLVFQLLNLGLLVYCVFLVRDSMRALFVDETAAVAAAVCFMASGSMAIWSLQGADVGIITAILLASLRLVLVACADSRAWPLRVYPLLALGIVARLDFAVVYGLFMLSSWLFPRPRFALATAAAVLIVTLGAILGFQYLYYGDALPNTYYLKASGTPIRMMFVRGVREQLGFCMRIAPLVAMAIGVFWAFKRSDRRLWLLGILPGGLLAYDVRVGSDWVFEYMSRFFTPGLPLLIMAAVGAAWELRSKLALMRPAGSGFTAISQRQRQALVGIVCALSVTSFNTSRELYEWFVPTALTMLRLDNLDNFRIATYLKEHSSADATLAVHWSGVLPYFLDRKTFDVLGKSDRHIARMHVNRFEPGHSKWDWRYMIEQRRPDFVDHVTRHLDELPAFTTGYVRTTFGLQELYVRKTSLGKLHDPSLRFTPVAVQE